jgi:hypothetical protein
MTVDPKTSFLVVSRRAGDDLAQLGVVSSTSDARDRTRVVIGAAGSGQIEALPETVETHFVARATMRGIDVALLCVERDGAPDPKSEKTIVITGALPANEAAELLAAGRGLAHVKINRGKI